MKALQYIKEGFFLMWLKKLKRWLYLSVTAYVIYALLWSAIYVGHDAWSINIKRNFRRFRVLRYVHSHQSTSRTFFATQETATTNNAKEANYQRFFNNLPKSSNCCFI